jgi:nucleotide-binding universal stress UspA family protein
MARAILVPLDGSEFSESALPVAVRLARASGGTVHLVRVHVPPKRAPISLEGMPVVDRDQDSRCWEAERAYMTRIRVRLGPRSELPTRIVVLNGPVKEVLATYAALHRVDLIVMATHGRSGLARAWMGSVADAVLRSSRVPVLMVCPVGGEPAAAVSGGRPRILITLDGSPAAERVLEPAVSLGRSLNAEYTLLRVVNPLGVWGDLPAVFAPRIARAFAVQQEAEAKAYLQEIACSMQDRGLEAKTMVVSAESAADAIRKGAEHEGAAFIAMATHGRGGLSRMLMGSVAGQVLHGATVPVLLYRAPVERRPLRKEPAVVRRTLNAACL